MDLSRSALSASAGMLSGPDAFVIAFLIIFLTDSSMLISRDISAGGISGWVSGSGRCQRSPLVFFSVTDLIVFLLVSSCQSPGDVVFVFRSSMCGACCSCLFC